MKDIGTSTQPCSKCHEINQKISIICKNCEEEDVENVFLYKAAIRELEIEWNKLEENSSINLPYSFRHIIHFLINLKGPENE
jgi:hypothetical protein